MPYKIIIFSIALLLASCANIKRERSTQWYDDPMLIEQSQALLNALPDSLPHEFILDANAPRKAVHDNLFLLPCHIDTARIVTSRGAEWERLYTSRDIKCCPLEGPWVTTYTLLYAQIGDEEPRYYSVPTLLRPETFPTTNKVLLLKAQPILIEDEYDTPIFMAVQME